MPVEIIDLQNPSPLRSRLPIRYLEVTVYITNSLIDGEKNVVSEDVESMLLDHAWVRLSWFVRFVFV